MAYQYKYILCYNCVIMYCLQDCSFIFLGKTNLVKNILCYLLTILHLYIFIFYNLYREKK